VTARVSLTPAARQRLTMTPAMHFALRILRMSTPDLVAEIAREAGENPFLSFARHGAGPRSSFDVALETVAARPSLGESLRSQIGAMVLPPALRALAEYLTGELREDGYLDSSVEEIAGFANVPPAQVEEALAVLQRCEPTGVGARDLAECLALQLGDHGIARPLADEVVARLPLFAARRWAALSADLGLPRDQLTGIASALRELKPEPVLAPAAPVPVLVPDLIVERQRSGAFAVRLGREALPALSLDRGLLARVEGSADPFVAERRERARRLIRAVRARGRTLLRIGERLVHDQPRFFAEGPETLAPCRRQDLAADLGLHPATVGRAVAGKALLAGGVLYPLSMFFSTALPGREGGEISAHSVRIAIRRLIDAEPPGAPMTDDRICERLREDGVDISRRTVAKYRQCMRIPSSSERRRRKG
jgi:RNA polymerase sigma-54 factor